MTIFDDLLAAQRNANALQQKLNLCKHVFCDETTAIESRRKTVRDPWSGWDVDDGERFVRVNRRECSKCGLRQEYAQLDATNQYETWKTVTC